MAFFKLFPTDLLVFNLSTWISDGENGLETASGDLLLALRCMQFPNHAYCYPTKLPTTEPVEHLQWLVDCQIALKKMFLSDDKIAALAANPMHLPSIQELRVSSPDLSGCLPAVLTLFPNLTALSLLDSSNPPSCGHLWEILTTTYLPHLKVLTSSWCPENMEDVVAKALLLNGEHLQELDLLKTKITTKLTPAIAACPQLVVLKMQVIQLTAADILLICQSCKLLKDLTLQWFGGTIGELDEVLHSCTALRRLTVSLSSPLMGRLVNAYDLLVHVFNTWPLLAVVDVEGCSYCRQTKHLQLTQHIDGGRLEHVLQAQFPVQMLTIVNKSSNGQSITTRAIAQYGSTLLEFTVDLCLVSDEAFACKLVALCPLLQKLSLKNISAADALLTCISINCRQLRGLELINRIAGLTVAGLEGLFVGCTQLKVLRLLGTNSIPPGLLQTLVRTRLPLERLTWSPNCTEEEYRTQYKQFCQDAIAASLVPVTKVTVSGKYHWTKTGTQQSGHK